MTAKAISALFHPYLTLGEAVKLAAPIRNLVIYPCCESNEQPLMNTDKRMKPMNQKS